MVDRTLQTGIPDAVREAFASVAGVVAVYVYGSAASGRMRPDSDVDVGVLFGAGAPTADARRALLAGIAARLGERLGRPIEIVSLAGAPVVLRRQVVARGRRVFEGDRRVSREFVARTLIEYWDLLPTLTLYDRALDRRFGVRRVVDGRP